VGWGWRAEGGGVSWLGLVCAGDDSVGFVVMVLLAWLLSCYTFRMLDCLSECMGARH